MKHHETVPSTISGFGMPQVRMGASLAMWSEYFPTGTVVGGVPWHVPRAGETRWLVGWLAVCLVNVGWLDSWLVKQLSMVG